MSPPPIKICGITTAETLEATIAARADYVGFNFYPPSPRYLALNAAPALAERAEGRILRVGLFVDAADEPIAEAVAAARLDALQLHGEESPERAARLRQRFGLPVWKVIPVATAEDVRRAAAYREAADFILFDAKTPKGTLPGGMGLSFDWSLLAADKGSLPWGLAGGLTPDNVAAAVAATRAPLVDAASGVESATGIKDAEKIAAFCSAARGL
jgi:phosphoribosylanthranilate isomerase